MDAEPPDEPAAEDLTDERAASRARDTRLVHAVRAGDANAFGQLYDAWFDRIYDLASRIVRDPDVAAEVAQDAFLSAWRSLPSLENPDAFGGWLLRIARNAAYNRSKKEGRSTAFDDQGLAMIESVGASPTSAPAGFGVEDRLGRAVTPGAALEDAEAVSLVWEAADALPERDREVLDLQLRHGLTPAEIGDVLGMNRNAANQLVHRLRGRLETAIRARVLWRGGQPSCTVLAARLRDAGVASFDAEAVRVVERHVPGCAECDERQKLRLQPAALFAAAPLLIAPQLVKQQAASALEVAGVPMQGSAFSGATTGAGAGSGTGSSTAASGHGGAPGDVVAIGQGAARTTTGGRRGLRNALLATAAAVIVVVGVIGFAARTTDDAQLAVGPAATSPSTTAGSTATTVAGTTSTSDGASTVPPSTPRPTVTTPPTTDTGPTTPTTSPTTSTTTTPPTVTFALTPNTVVGPSWSLVALRAGTPPTLAWQVSATGKVTVAVTGPDAGRVDQILSSDASGSFVVCPGTRETKTPTCTTQPGSYVFTLTVYGPDGSVLAKKTATLTVQPPPPIN